MATAVTVKTILLTSVYMNWFYKSDIKYKGTRIENMEAVRNGTEYPRQVHVYSTTINAN